MRSLKRLDINNKGTFVSPFGDGSFFNPFNNFIFAAQQMPANGILWILPGSYLAIGAYNKPMILQAPFGNVVLGNGN